jgi:hypothetical protein
MQHCVRICLWAHPQCLLTSSIDLIVQPRRFDVYENFGCRSAVYPSVATLFVVWIPPLALSLLTICFCGKSLYYCMYLARLSLCRHYLAPLSPSRRPIFEDTCVFLAYVWSIHSARQYGHFGSHLHYRRDCSGDAI